jgi:hypothetical protein
VTDLAASSVASQVYPGLLGFLVVAGMGLALYFLFRSMNKQLRKISPDAHTRPGAQRPGLQRAAAQRRDAQRRDAQHADADAGAAAAGPGQGSDAGPSQS